MRRHRTARTGTCRERRHEGQEGGFDPTQKVGSTPGRRSRPAHTHARERLWAEGRRGDGKPTCRDVIRVFPHPYTTSSPGSASLSAETSPQGGEAGRERGHRRKTVPLDSCREERGSGVVVEVSSPTSCSPEDQ